MKEHTVTKSNRIPNNESAVPLLLRLFRGLSHADKTTLAARLDITLVHLGRIIQEPGLISIDRARIIMEFLEPLYGETVVSDAFNLKLLKP